MVGEVDTLDAKQVAGGYGMAALYGIVPPLMAWRLRYGTPPPSTSATDVDSTRIPLTGSHLPMASTEGSSRDGEWVPGGRAALAALCTSAVAVEAGQLALDLHWL